MGDLVEGIKVVEKAHVHQMGLRKGLPGRLLEFEMDFLVTPSGRAPGTSRANTDGLQFPPREGAGGVCALPHSYRRASMGLRRAARLAG